MQPRTLRFYLAIATLAIFSILAILIESVLGYLADRDHILWMLDKLPYLAFCLLGFLALKFNQGRTFFVAVAWLTAYALLRNWPARADSLVSTHELIDAIAVGLPAATLGVLLFAEGRVVGALGALRLCIAVATPLALIAVAGADIEAGTYLFYPEAAKGLWQIPLLAPALVVVAAVVLGLSADRHARYVAHTAAAALFPVTIALNKTALAEVSAAPGHAAGIGFSVCAFIFIYSLYRAYWEKAYVDELTEVLNRRALNEKMYGMGRHYAMTMVDIDHFKAFNDAYGHAQGDTVLRFLAAHLERAFPGHVYRYGGEEFCVLFDGATLKTSARRIEAVRHLVSSKDFHIRLPQQARNRTSAEDRGKHQGSPVRVHINFSAGVASRSGPLETPEHVLELADKALYAAKANGRGRVTCHE